MRCRLQFYLPRNTRAASSISLPTSKTLTLPTPGRIGSTNSFPATIAISPDGRYAALLNDGYGTQETLATQSIAVLDLKTNQLSDYPDKRLGDDAHQSYFLGLVFGSDGKHLYASVGSITDPTGQKPGDLGNGIAVYAFTDGKVAPERFIPIEPQALAAGKKVSIALRKTPSGTAIPYPAGMALISARGRAHASHDRLLVADNLSDNIVLLDVASGKVLQTLRPQHQRPGPIFVSLHLRGHARWPPRLVQPVECVARRPTGSHQRQGRALDQIERARRSGCSGLTPHGNALKP